MAGKRIASFIDNLRDSQLLPSQQLDEVARSPLAQGDDPTPLARELLQRHTLTPYQVNQLVRGRGRELSLGSYRLLDRIGEGGMGQVFKAFHQPMNRVVALKVIRKEKLAKAEAVSRFYQEIRAAAQLHHPNVVIAYDAGQAGEVHFFAMEFVEGIDLAKLVKEKGPLPVAASCAFVRQAALGLQHAQEKGLVHRDIKPANLLLTRAPGAQGYGLVKILDFGLARLHGLDGEGTGNDLTKTGTVVGTPDYLAPEQARNSRAVDIRADLYSLGCTLFYLLTGRPPFKGEHLTEVLLQHQSDPPPPLSDFRKDVPAGVQVIVSRLLAKRPEERFQTPAELIAALAPFTGKAGAKRAALDVPTSETLVASADADTPLAPHAGLVTKPVSRPWQLLRRLPQRWRWAAIAGLGLAPILALILLIAALSGGPRATTGSQAGDSSKPGVPRDPLEPLFGRLRAGGRDNKLETTDIIGGFPLDKPFQEVPPDGALLLGFRYSMGDFFGHHYIVAIRPLFLTAQGERPGTEYGKIQGVVQEVRAGKGYVVAGITIKSTFVVDGFLLTYMRIGPNGLDKTDVVKSDWVGGKGGKESSLGATGAPVIGINGRVNKDGVFTGLGLVLLKP